MGSIADNGGGSILYRTSKTALNMAVSCLAKEIGNRGAIAVLLHPGHVRTDMGGATAPVTASDSAAGMRKVIDGLTPRDNGSFRNHDGATLPWRSEEHTSELQSLMRISYAVFCLKKKKNKNN